jgi:16S rRNA C1402 (ribose-2'-O) methylase RsmI
MKKINIIAPKDLKMGKNYLYAFDVNTRNNYKKANKENKIKYLFQLVKNGNITMQFMTNIIIKY